MLPFNRSVISDADAFEIAQPDPSKVIVGDPVVVHLEKDGDAIAAERVVAFGVMARALQPRGSSAAARL